MGLKVASQIIVKRTCTIRVPLKGTAHRNEEIKVNFRVLKNSEEDELYNKTFVPPLREDFVSEADFRREMQSFEANQRLYSRQLLRKVVDSWDEDSNITDDNDQPMPFSPEALDDLLNLPYAVVGLVKSYREAIEGKQGAKGN